jgi:hypothetical protein
MTPRVLKPICVVRREGSRHLRQERAPDHSSLTAVYTDLTLEQDIALCRLSKHDDVRKTQSGRPALTDREHPENRDH